MLITVNLMSKNDLLTKEYFDKRLDEGLGNFITKAYLDKKLKNFVTKDYLDKKLDERLSNFVTKDYLDKKLDGRFQEFEVRMDKKFDEKFSHYFGLITEEFRNRTAFLEEIVLDIRKSRSENDEKFDDHEGRITRLESVVKF